MTAHSVRRCLIVSTAYADPAPRGKLRALAGLGLEVIAVVPQQWPDPVYGRLQPATWARQHGVEIFPLPVSTTDAATARFPRRALAALLRDKRPDVMQIEEPPGGALATQAADAARRARVPVVFCSHTNVRWGDGWWAGRRRRRTIRAARGALAGSSAAADLLFAVRPELPVEVVLVHGAPVPPAPTHVAHEGQHLAYVGRLERRRGLDTLLHALATRRAHAWTLCVVGDGPDRVPLESLASELRLAARVEWAGALPADQVRALWPGIDVLVHPGRRRPDWEEPHGDMVAEAMGHEVAVIGTLAGVVPEVIGEAGLLVPPDDPVSLADAIAVLADPTQQQLYATAARARALAEFTDEAIAERTLTFWRGVLA